jgi:hypothetical protein
MINQVTKITEKLQLPSTDTNVAVLRLLRKVVLDEAIAGWVLDEGRHIAKLLYVLITGSSLLSV